MKKYSKHRIKNKRYRKTPILDTARKYKPTGDIAGKALLAVLSLIFTVSIAVVMAGSAGPLTILSFMAIPMAPLALCTNTIVKSLKKQENIKKQLGISCDEELETFLEKCERLDDLVYRTDDCIIYLGGDQLFSIDNISYVHPCNIRSNDGFPTTYSIVLKLKTGRMKNIIFRNVYTRDSAIEDIRIAVELYNNRKYIA